jgi:hypothetical protein
MAFVNHPVEEPEKSLWDYASPRCEHIRVQESKNGSVEEEKFENIGEIKPEEPQVPEVDLQPFPKGLKYEFLGPDKTYPVIVSDELSPEENEKLLILLKNIGR